LTPQDLQTLFTRTDGSYLFARWGRPIVPVVFGVEDASLAVVKGAIEAVAALAGLEIAETDPELGANLMVFFLRDWAELPKIHKFDQLVPDLAALCQRLSEAEAHHYRLFRFDQAGAIKAAFVFLRMDEALQAVPAQDLALKEAVQMILLWGEAAFAARSALGRIGDVAVLRPEIAEVIRRAYDPVLPAVARDPSHAVRLAARVLQGLAAQGL
jgi:hypothetical protein